jgi:tetrahydromethanopterin S-methyltransferase subunit H
MPAGYVDQYIEQGTTFTSELSLNDVNGNPYNLNGYTVRSQARRSYYSSNASITFTSTVLDANNGIIRLSANSGITSNVKAGKLVYDVVLIETSTNNVTRILEGQIFVSPTVTR